MEKSQKILIISLIVAAIVLLGISFTVGGETTTSSKTSDNSTELSAEVDTIMENAQKESDSVKDSEKKELSEINVDKYLEYYKGSNLKIVLLARPTCGYCAIATPIIENIAYEYDLDIYYLNTDNFKGDDENNFAKSNEAFSEGFGTPMLLAVKDSKLVDEVDGLTDRSHYVEFLKAMEVIK